MTKNNSSQPKLVSSSRTRLGSLAKLKAELASVGAVPLDDAAKPAAIER